MNEFFKVKVAYPSESESGTISNKREEFLVEAVSYQDAETTAYSIVEYYGMDNIGNVSWEITKIKVPELCIAFRAKVDNGGINKMNVVSTIDNDFELANEENGLYKVQFSYIDIEDKVRKETVYFYVTSFYDLKELLKSFNKEYYNNSKIIIESVKKEKMNTLILLDETYEYATSFGDNLAH